MKLQLQGKAAQIESGANQRSDQGDYNMRITVFTPTYNRANTLYRVYDSLASQTYRDFQWIVIDDGSTDGTKRVVEGYAEKADFPVIYKYQPNSGKHTAINRAVEMCGTEFFIIADSDDAFKAESLEVFIDEWESIPLRERDSFKGVICKCYDAKTGEDIGSFPGDHIDTDELTAGFILKFRFEKWSFFRTDVLREFPFPEPKGHLKFFPETVVWQQMSRKYKTRYINVALRAYFRDQGNALTSNDNLRYRENIYLWQHYINNVRDYARYNPKLFLKAYVGIIRDGLLDGKNIRDVFEMIDRKSDRAIVAMCYPAAVILEKKYLHDHKNYGGVLRNDNYYWHFACSGFVSSMSEVAA